MRFLTLIRMRDCFIGAEKFALYKLKRKQNECLIFILFIIFTTLFMKYWCMGQEGAQPTKVGQVEELAGDGRIRTRHFHV